MSATQQDNLATIGPENAVSAEDVPMIKEFVAEAVGHLEIAEAQLLRLEENPRELESINTIFRSFHTIKGVAGFLNLKQIGALAHTAENLLDKGRKAQLTFNAGTVDIVLQALDLMKALIADVDDAAKTNRTPKQFDTLPALLSRIESAVRGEETQKIEPALQVEIVDAPAKPAHATKSTVKVATERLDSLIDMVGELVIAQSMLGADITSAVSANPRVGRNLAHASKIARELQDLSMSMRMVPIAGVFQKMARVVRDLSHKAGKPIELITEGGDTELDRNLVEVIDDPLVHMIRNAVDHAIEAPEDRLATGKASEGKIFLQARHEGGGITITVRDDGRGLDKAKILNKARAAGIVDANQELSDQDIFRLIFHAGLSTAEKVTDVSGRGVGMDVVRRNIQSLRGRIDIESTPGVGTTFTIRLPLTLALIDGLLVRVGGETYVLPITNVEQSLRPTAEQISSIQGRGEMLLSRGSLMPVYRLHKLFSIAGAVEDATQGLVVIVQDNQTRCAFVVDALIGQQQVVIKSLSSNAAARGIAGGAILGDGTVSLILDVPGLIDLASGDRHQITQQKGERT